MSKKKDPVAYKNHCYTYANLYTDISLSVGKSVSRTVISSASDDASEVCLAQERYTNSEHAKKAYFDNLAYWEKEF